MKEGGMGTRSKNGVMVKLMRVDGKREENMEMEYGKEFMVIRI